MHYFAYTVTVRGKKRFGGCLRAESMDDAANRAARICKLTKTVPDMLAFPTQLELNGAPAHLAVWAIPGLLDIPESEALEDARD